MIATPLQVIVISLKDGPRGDEGPRYVETAYRVFSGADPMSPLTVLPVWMVGKRLDLAECFLPLDTIPSQPAAVLFNQALHTLVIAWVHEHSLKNDDYVRWLAQTWKIADSSNDRHGLLLGIADERLRNQLLERADALGVSELRDCQIKTWEGLAEDAARPGVAALTFLEAARDLLVAGMGKHSHKLSLFVSHAKLDGLSLANSLVHTIRQTASLDSFYDAIDIKPGSNWRASLQKAVESSVLISVRTNAYDDRPFCVEEINWAEKAGAPIIVVEARSDFYYAPAPSVMEASPWVLVPDGSITRILVCTLRENLRLLLVRRAVASAGPAVDDSTVVLPRAPSWISLGGAIERLPNSGGGAQFIVYPDPCVTQQTHHYLNQFAQALKPSAQVLAYNQFAALH